MDDNKRTRLQTELHLHTVDLEYLKSKCVLVRPMTHGLELFLKLDEILEFIKMSEVPPEGFKVMELDEASKLWNKWRCPSKTENKSISIAEVFNRCDPAKNSHRFLGWCKLNKIAPKVRPGDFYWNPSYRGDNKDAIFEKICNSAILKNLLVNNCEFAS